MQFLKAHYEKIILSVVLLGLAAAAAFMLIKVEQESQKETERKDTLVSPRVREFPKLDLTNQMQVLARLEQPVNFNLGGEHVVFNPVRWQRRPDGGLLRGSETGVKALTVTQITPLNLRVEYVGLAPGAKPDNARYRIAVQRETGRNTRPSERLASVKTRNNLFSLEEVAGDPMEPQSFKILLEGDKEPITIAPGKPYERIIGYSADFRYEPENRTWRDLKVRDELTFGGETYNIVAITEKEVVVSAKSNKKQTTLELNASK